MGAYSISGRDTNTQSTTIIAVIGHTTSRLRIYDLVQGSDATPADNAGEYVLNRCQSMGVGTAVSPLAFDPADATSVASGAEALTTEAGYTANAHPVRWAQNQRATFRWVAAPGGEVVIAATAGAGVGVYVFRVAGSAVVMNANIHWTE